MKISFFKKSIMGYYYQEGQIGEYKGWPVYIINNEDLRIDTAKMDVIYAVRKPNCTKMWLVLDGQCIGTMDNEGDIRRRTAYHWDYYKPEKKKVVKEVVVTSTATATVTPKVDIDNYDYTVDLKAYSGVVDEVFKNLNKWWDNLEK